MLPVTMVIPYIIDFIIKVIILTTIHTIIFLQHFSIITTASALGTFTLNIAIGITVVNSTTTAAITTTSIPSATTINLLATTQPNNVPTTCLGTSMQYYYHVPIPLDTITFHPQHHFVPMSHPILTTFRFQTKSS